MSSVATLADQALTLVMSSSPFNTECICGHLTLLSFLWKVIIKDAVLLSQKKFWCWVSCSPWLRVARFAHQLSGGPEGCYRGLSWATGSRGEQTVPHRELCSSYQRMLAVLKQAAAIAASGWAGGGSSWQRAGVQVGRFKGVGEF